MGNPVVPGPLAGRSCSGGPDRGLVPCAGAQLAVALDVRAPAHTAPASSPSGAEDGLEAWLTRPDGVRLADADGRPIHNSLEAQRPTAVRADRGRRRRRVPPRRAGGGAFAGGRARRPRYRQRPVLAGLTTGSAMFDPVELGRARCGQRPGEDDVSGRPAWRGPAGGRAGLPRPRCRRRTAASCSTARRACARTSPTRRPCPRAGAARHDPEAYDVALDGADRRGRSLPPIGGAVRRTLARERHPRVGSRRASGGQVLRVEDPVRVALLGQEPLPVLGELGVDGVAGDDRVEVRRLARRPSAAAAGRAAAPPPAGSRRSRTPGSRPRPSGRSIEKLATLRDDQQPDLAGAERLEQPLPLLHRRLALDQRARRGPRRSRRAGRGTARSPASAGRRAGPTSSRTTSILWWRAGREPVALLRLGGRVGEPLAPRAGSPAPRRSRPARSSPAPRCPSTGRRTASGPIRREHVALAAVLAHQRRGQPDPAPGLEVGGHPEDRRRQQVDLVVDDQAPVAGVEQLEVAGRRPSGGSSSPGTSRW